MPRRRLGHVPALDGLRGIAILLVVAHHTGNMIPWTSGHLRGGALGVDLFFVLSGFLITSLLLAEWSGSGTVSLRSFYGRRARRLLPALLALVGLAWLLSIALNPQRAPEASLFALARLSYFGNFLIAFGGGLGKGFVHLWSLAQEEQFYLLWPPVLLFLLRRHVAPRRVLWLLIALIGAVNVDRLVIVLLGAGEQRLWYAPDTHGDAILFGCAAAIAWAHGLVRVPRGATPVALLVAIPILATFRAYHPVDYPVELPLFAGACSLLLLAIVESPEGRVARLLSMGPLRRLGTMSYGLYLWHLTLLDFFGLIGLPDGSRRDRALVSLHRATLPETPAWPARPRSGSGNRGSACRTCRWVNKARTARGP